MAPNPKTIVPVLDAIESQAIAIFATEIDAEVERLVRDALTLTRTRDLNRYLANQSGLNLAFQRALLQLWANGISSGSDHALAEMRGFLPTRYTDSVLFDRVDGLRILAREILEMVPLQFRNLPAERSLKTRILHLSGDFAADIIGKLKVALLDSLKGEVSRPKLIKRIESTVNVSKARAQTIARTETTNSYNQGRNETYNQSDLVTHLVFYAISDKRTTDICKSRNGMVIPKANAAMVRANTPALHYQCRSVLSGLLPAVIPAHSRMVNDPARSPLNRRLVPLPTGWKI